MIKHITSDSGLTSMATIGLVIFVLVFLAVTVWILTRPKKTVSKWSQIPLQDGHDPVEPRNPRKAPETHPPASSSTPTSATEGESHV